MTTRIRKLGDEFVFVIPPELATQPGFGDDGEVEVGMENGTLVVRPVARLRTRYTLAEALAGITDENIHPETSTGPAGGNEVW